ncbi:MAG: hypothetical protein ACTSYI_11915 [Promethearchaeota archaeon]
MDIKIDFAIYVPTPGTYYSYIELLRAHDYLASENQIEKILLNFENSLDPLEEMDHSSREKK